ncbi:MAG: hypothetical protein JXQ75_09200, partial [Phycisphaerae bacterium]|nr:hypothetical protein [Phycisphaerae bacterium]
VAVEYDAADANQPLRYFVHGETYVDELAVLHDVAKDQDYAYELDAMYCVVGLVSDSGRLIRGYAYNLYGDRRELATDLDLIVAVRNHLGQTVTTETAAYDLNGDSAIDLLDLMQARIPPEMPTRQPYGFHGRRLATYKADDQHKIALYDFRARVLDPLHGRFMQRDPAEYADSYNLYLAFGGNPLAHSDPTGRSLLSLLGRAGTGLWAAWNVVDTAMGVKDWATALATLLNARARTWNMYWAIGRETVFLIGDKVAGPIDELFGIVRGLRVIRKAKAVKPLGQLTRSELTDLIRKSAKGGDIGKATTQEGLPNFLKALREEDFREIWSNTDLKAGMSRHIRDWLGGKRTDGQYHEWVQVHLLPELMKSPDKGAWIDAMLTCKKKIEGEFASIHSGKPGAVFHGALDDLWEPGMSVRTYLERIANSAWGSSFP